MNQIERLISIKCPSGVMYKDLGDVASYTRGVTYRKNQEVEREGIRILRSNNITQKSNTLNFEDVKLVSDSVRVRNDQRLRCDDILISAASGSKAHIGKVAFIKKDTNYYFGGFMAVLRTNGEMNSKFLFHILTGQMFKDYLERALSTTTINNLSASIIRNFRIPVPPLYVQQEIIRILDTFTELEAELEARRKQYKYYRDELLSFQDLAMRGGVRQTLGDLCMKTDNIKWAENKSQNYAYIDLSSVCRKHNQIVNVQTVNAETAPSRARQIVLEDDILYGTTRPTLKRLCHISSKFHGQICSTGFCVLRANKQRILPKYLYFAITTTSFDVFVELNQKGASYPAISNAKLKSYTIIIPSLDEQERIVATLSKFDKLANDLSFGLPTEIKARRQQYEYYRNKLLTFKEIS